MHDLVCLGRVALLLYGHRRAQGNAAAIAAGEGARRLELGADLGDLAFEHGLRALGLDVAKGLCEVAL